MTPLKVWELLKMPPQKDLQIIDEIFGKLHRIFAMNSISKNQIVEILTGFLPEFSHIEKGKNLDQRIVIYVRPNKAND